MESVVRSGLVIPQYLSHVEHKQITYKLVLTMKRANRLGLMITYIVYEQSDGRYVVMEPSFDSPDYFVTFPPLASLQSAVSMAQGLLAATVDMMNKRIPVDGMMPVSD